MFAEVACRLARNNRTIVEEHARCSDLAAQDVWYMFSQGDLCLLCAPGVGKLKTLAVGPYTFLCCTGWRGINAEIVGASGARITVSVTNLCIMNPPTYIDEYIRRIE